jgi:hypothetical protein
VPKAGWKTKTIIGLEDAYGTATALSDPPVVPIISEGIREEQILIMPPSTGGAGGLEKGRLSGTKHYGPLSLFPAYGATDLGDKSQRLIRHVGFGSETQVVPGTTRDYLHKPTATQPPSLFIAFAKDDSIREYTGGKIQMLTIRSSVEDLLWALDLDLGFQTLNTARTSSPTDPSTWAYKDFEPIAFENTTLYINDYTAGALGGADEVEMTGFEIILVNDYPDRRTKESGTKIAEPKRLKRIATGRFDVLEAAGFQEDLDAQKYKKAIIEAEYTSQITGRTYTETLYIPKFKFLTIPDTTPGPGFQPINAEIQLFIPETPPAGFPDQTTAELMWRSIRTA